MSGRGVHFSLDAAEVEALRATDESERFNHIFEVIEPDYFKNHRDRMAESDKAWDAIHRVLTDGFLHWDSGTYPLNHIVLGGERLDTEGHDIIVLSTPQQVRDAAAALPAMTEDEFRRRYFAIDAADYEFAIDEEDLEYTWSSFEIVRTFWMRAASEDRFVLFTADQ